MNRRRALWLGLLLAPAILPLEGCWKLASVSWVAFIYYPQDPQACPDGVYVGMDFPSSVRVLGVDYTVREHAGNRENVPMLNNSSFLITKPALAPDTPEEAAANGSVWDGFYTAAFQLTDETIRFHFRCEGSGRTEGEEGHVAPYDWRNFVLVEDPSRPSGLRVLEAEP